MIREEKKKLMFRDDFLMVLAFTGAGILQWQARENPNFAVVLEPLSYVLGTIGVLILYGILATRKSRQLKEKRKKKLL